MADGVVKIWKMEEGWGVIASPDLPAGHDAWAHFSDILAEGYRALEAGQRVEFEIVQREQDGFAYVATNVRAL
ncbi:cold shock protein (beta-ribbon, CspA family) [Nonomuraea solani]|uniref:Cold shock protein (Beta-ribbon, CspA family) n=1 Tax=Nonomuraea solani TaxID=1144553 RepID=A0A1H6EQL0_9ACTN|nr:cold shock domain-containing protein [Nonomuraea solani]SEG99225.1 cold shock protein (beta-ribbon, CspA family) [Nonomuraea solani]